MLDSRARRVIDPPLNRIAVHLAGSGVHADLLTLIGFGFGVLAAVAVAFGLPLTSFGLLLANRLLDGLDGAVARRNGATDRGGFLDIVLDFIIYSGVVFAFAVADPARNALPAAFLIFSFIGTGSSFLAFAIMAAKRRLETTARGAKSLYYLGGITEGTETVAVLAVACLLPELFPLLAWIFGGLCWLTTLGRIATACQTLR